MSDRPNSVIWVSELFRRRSAPDRERVRTRLRVEEVESRLCPTDIGGSAVTVASPTADKPVTLSVAFWTYDSDDPGEGENLIIHSANGAFPDISMPPVIRTDGSTQPFQNIQVAGKKGDTITAYVSGYDGDETAIIKGNDTDLEVEIDGNKITPTDDTSLHLRHFWGGEQVTVPATVQNLGKNNPTYPFKVEVYLSNTGDADNPVGGKPLLTKTFSFKPNNGSKDTMTLDGLTVTIPNNLAAGGLAAGGKTYFVVKITPNPKDDNNDDNNEAATSTDFEYVGNAGSSFDEDLYFDSIKAALGRTTISYQGAPEPNDGPHFTAAFENPGGYDKPKLAPYLDSKDLATIGTGLNLQGGLTATEQATLAGYVKQYYAAQAQHHVQGYTNINAMSTGAVIQMLIDQAQQGHAPQAWNQADAIDLYNTVYARNQTAAIAAANAKGVNWAAMWTGQWVLTDIQFNTKGGLAVFKQLLGALAGGSPDFVRAGFQLINSDRSNDVQSQRSIADYAFLVLAGEHEYLGS